MMSFFLFFFENFLRNDPFSCIDHPRCYGNATYVDNGTKILKIYSMEISKKMLEIIEEKKNCRPPGPPLWPLLTPLMAVPPSRLLPQLWPVRKAPTFTCLSTLRFRIMWWYRCLFCLLATVSSLLPTPSPHPRFPMFHRFLVLLARESFYDGCLFCLLDTICSLPPNPWLISGFPRSIISWSC